MNVFVLSHRCGHCVHRQLVLSDDEYEAAWRGCVGRPCPVCGVRPKKDDLQISLPDKELRALEDGTLPWGEANRSNAAFAAFTTTAAPPVVRGEFANSLRDRVYGESARARKREYTALSDVFASLSGLRFGAEARDAGNPRRAVVWLERAAATTEDPATAAGSYFYLGLSRLELGERGKARDAFRAALGYPTAPETLRAAAGDQLGSVLKALGDLDGARAAFQVAIDTADPLFAPKAALNLGTLEDEAGNHDRARPLWEYTYEHVERSNEVWGTAVYNLGWYWEGQGDAGKARRYYELAVSSNAGEPAARATDRLRGLPSARRGLFGRRG